MTEHNKDPAYEFEFMRDKLKHIATLLADTENASNLLEVSFYIGCLHSICHENWVYFKKDDE